MSTQFNNAITDIYNTTNSLRAEILPKKSGNNDLAILNTLDYNINIPRVQLLSNNINQANQTYLNLLITLSNTINV